MFFSKLCTRIGYFLTLKKENKYLYTNVNYTHEMTPSRKMIIKRKYELKKARNHNASMYIVKMDYHCIYKWNNVKHKRESHNVWHESFSNCLVFVYNY